MHDKKYFSNQLLETEIEPFLFEFDINGGKGDVKIWELHYV